VRRPSAQGAGFGRLHFQFLDAAFKAFAEVSVPLVHAEVVIALRFAHAADQRQKIAHLLFVESSAHLFARARLRMHKSLTKHSGIQIDVTLVSNLAERRVRRLDAHVIITGDKEHGEKRE
jgi:hypothetical protein